MTSITSAALHSTIVGGHAPSVLDVRSRWEYARGHIPGAVHVPFWKCLMPTPVPLKRDAAVVVYCGHGPRAWLAAYALQRRGWSVSCLNGHMAGWRRAGLPLS